MGLFSKNDLKRMKAWRGRWSGTSCPAPVTVTNVSPLYTWLHPPTYVTKQESFWGDEESIFIATKKKKDDCSRHGDARRCVRWLKHLCKKKKILFSSINSYMNTAKQKQIKTVFHRWFFFFSLEWKGRRGRPEWLFLSKRNQDNTYPLRTNNGRNLNRSA